MQVTRLRAQALDSTAYFDVEGLPLDCGHRSACAPLLETPADAASGVCAVLLTAWSNQKRA